MKRETKHFLFTMFLIFVVPILLGLAAWWYFGGPATDAGDFPPTVRAGSGSPGIREHGVLDRQDCDIYCHEAGGFLGGMTYDRTTGASQCHCDIYSDD